MKSIKDLYQWMMEKSKHRMGIHFLCAFSFIESIFFPIPVDPFLIALSVAKPKKALLFGFFTTLFSVLGALLGYFIGAFFWGFFEVYVTDVILSKESLELVFEKLQKNGFSALFLSALTPLPFKVFALASGIFKLNLFIFLIGAFLGRGLRFISLGLLFYIYGARIRGLIEKYFEKILWLTAFAFVLCLLLYFFMF